MQNISIRKGLVFGISIILIISSFSFIVSADTTIQDNSPDTAEAGDSFIVNATVSDDDGIDSVWVEYWFDLASKTNVSMTNTGGDYWEYDSISIPLGSGDDLYYNLSARNSTGFWSHLNNQQVVVIYINTSVDDISPYNQTNSPLTINATNNGDSVDNITLYYRYSTDNSSWGDETYTLGVPNSEFMNPTGHGNEYDCVAYSSDRNSTRAYFSPEYNGTAQDITIRYYYGSGSNSKMKCALYYENETFIAETEEKTLPGGSGYGNVTFNFTGDKPEIYSDETYILAQWFDETGADYTYINCFGDTDRFNYGDAEDYDNGTFPEPLDDDDHALWDGWSLAIICHYTIGTSWVEWNDTSNPDTSSPWQWSFDFPNGKGYYEFYSIGKKSGFSDESAPASADAICYFNEDTTPPEITNVDAQPDPQETGGYVNITCDVTDVVAVDEVWVNITYPDSSYHNESMLGGSYYYNTTYTALGTYDYFIWANDTSGNSNTSASYSFVVQAITPPEITNVDAQPDPQDAGWYVNITCDVDDNVAVDEVWVNITYPDSSYHNFSMYEGSYYFNQTYMQLGTYTYFIWANDTSGNGNTSSVYDFIIQQDTTPPASITNLQNVTGETWINWMWTNPPDFDFNYTIVYLNGTWMTNTSNPFYNATGLDPEVSYEIGTHTVDYVGNINTTWVNQTSKTLGSSVHNIDTGLNYSTIQAAIDATETNDGHTILVDSGIYTENVDVYKSLTIRSTSGNPADTIVQAENSSDHVFEVTADYVNISGFKVKDATDTTMAGIGLSLVENCNIFNNYATNNFNGILLYRSSNIMVANNTAFSNNVNNIYLPQSSGNFIRDNIVVDSEWGICVYLSSNDNIIVNNTVMNHYWGIWLRGSCNNNTIAYNIAMNSTHGIYLQNSRYNMIVNNNFTNNTNGIYLRSFSNKNTIANNTVTDNDYGIYLYLTSNNNTIYNNYFNNTYNAWDDGNNIWNITKTSGTNIIGGAYLGGNYWSDYNGTDTDGDGLGDTNLPYNCSGNIQNGGDWLPLVFGSLDTIPPQITNVDAQPDPQETGGYVNITCDVTDVVAVDEVRVNITYPDSSYHNETMLGGSYYYNTTYTMLGTYDYFIWANDTSGNSNTSANHTFTIQDITSPEIIDNTSNVGYTGDSFTFNATITDNVDVFTVWVEYWYGIGSHINTSMTNVGGDYWEKAITINDTLDTLHYIVSANDTSNNWNYTGVKDVAIYDNDDPEISNVQAIPSIQNSGGHVNVSASVIDNVGVDEVRVNITYPDSSYHNESMLGGSYYYNTSYTMPGTYDYFIWANDTSGNSNTSAVYNFEIKKLHNLSLKEKWNLISIPCYENISKTNIMVRNNSIEYNWTAAIDEGIILDYIYKWNTTTGYGDTSMLEPGLGYWIWTYYDCELLIPSNAVGTGDITDMQQKWNIMGLPYTTSLDKEDLIVHYNGTDYSWENATSNNNPTGGPIILGFIYDWDRTNQIYILSDEFDPGYGYWMYAYYNCSLLRPEI